MLTSSRDKQIHHRLFCFTLFFPCRRVVSLSFVVLHSTMATKTKKGGLNDIFVMRREARNEKKDYTNQHRKQPLSLWLRTAYYLATYVSIQYAFVKFPYKTYGFLPLFATFPPVLLLLAIDFATSNTPHTNVRRLQKNGFSIPYQIFCFASEFLMSHGGTFFFLNILCTDVLCPGEYCELVGGDKLNMDPEFSIATVMKTIRTVLLQLFFSDTVFVPLHQYFLHKWFPSVHLMHHVCISASIHSAYCFSPLDFVLEFVLPLGSSVLLHVFVLQDAFGFWAFMMIVFTWYFMAHDEVLKLAHWRHHKFCNQDYSAYIWNLVYNN